MSCCCFLFSIFVFPSLSRLMQSHLLDVYFSWQRFKAHSFALLCFFLLRLHASVIWFEYAYAHNKCILAYRPFIVMILPSAIDSSWLYDLITLALHSFNENNNHCMVSQNKRTKKEEHSEPFKTNALEYVCVRAYVYVATVYRHRCYY